MEYDRRSREGADATLMRYRPTAPIGGPIDAEVIHAAAVAAAMNEVQ